MNRAVESHLGIEVVRLDARGPLGWITNHPRLVDGLLIAIYAAMHVWMLLAVRPTHGPAVLITVVLSAVALTRRRQRPKSVLMVITGLAVVAGLLLPGVSYSPGAVFIVLYEVAKRWPLRRVWGWYVLAGAVPLVTRLLWQTFTSEWLMTVQTPGLFGVIAVVLGAATRARHERRMASAALLQARLEGAAARERARIAAEMHDIVSHSLSVMIALAQGAATGWRQHPTRAREALRHLSEVGTTALRDTRRLLTVLNENDEQSPAATHPPQSLDDLVGTFRTAGLPVALSRTGSSGDPGGILGQTVYRIVQESLTNTLRHANAPKHVNVIVHREPEQLMVTTIDDGLAIRRPRREGYGLLNLAQHAAAFDGESESGPGLGGGWCTRVLLKTTAEPPQ